MNDSEAACCRAAHAYNTHKPRTTLDNSVIVNEQDLLDDGLRPLKAALLVLLRHAGATKLAKALEPGVMD